MILKYCHKLFKIKQKDFCIIMCITDAYMLKPMMNHRDAFKFLLI